MKYLKLTLVSIICVGLATAQVPKGTKSVGGGFAYSSISYDGDAMYTMMNVNPSVNYFVMDNIAVSVGFTMTTLTPEGGDAETDTGFGVGGNYFITQNIYAGGTYNSSTPDGGDASTSLNIRGGYLHGLSETVYLDVNGNYMMGMGDNKMGGIMLGVGVVSFF